MLYIEPVLYIVIQNYTMAFFFASEHLCTFGGRNPNVLMRSRYALVDVNAVNLLHKLYGENGTKDYGEHILGFVIPNAETCC